MSTRAALCFFLNASALVMCDTTVAMASCVPTLFLKETCAKGR